jgi:Kef-type K+ transport system membrane component KefB
VVFGNSGLKKIPVHDSTLTLLATMGFALLMFTAGSHIDYRALTKRAVRKAVEILTANFIVAVVVAIAVSHVSHFSHWQLLAVISFSSSAALVIPLLERSASSESISTLIAQVTIADALAFIALPFFTQRKHQFEALGGALLVLIASTLIYLALRFARSREWLSTTHQISKEDHLGLELRISMALLLLVSALAIHFHASVMIAGFTLGVALASIGVPHRLAKQLFAVSEGFFTPLYFLWLGASIDVRATFHTKHTILLAMLLVVAALIAHAPQLLFKQPIRSVFLSSAQLGIPAAAVTLGSQNGLLTGGESGAIMLSALVTILFTI